MVAGGDGGSQEVLGRRRRRRSGDDASRRDAQRPAPVALRSRRRQAAVSALPPGGRAGGRSSVGGPGLRHDDASDDDRRRDNGEDESRVAERHLGPRLVSVGRHDAVISRVDDITRVVVHRRLQQLAAMTQPASVASERLQCIHIHNTALLRIIQAVHAALKSA